ncbi:hypothetical protein SASPL_147308 [Salvia splendens]|uniref:Protein kinase domain-containing protein n=1 Tax=Salvia splendens TaxID=180675 RepID=A0A8X8WEZ1_SALSN|nr:hypothetical protein SASPL_147308 [Salvia splendens]
METAKFHSKGKHKTSTNKTEPRPNGKQGMKGQLNEETPSNATKQYIENHYKEKMKNLQERRERYDIFLSFTADYWILLHISPLHAMFSLHDQYTLCTNSQILNYMFRFSYRRNMLEKKLADADVSAEEQNNILKKKETEDIKPDNLLLDKNGHMKLSDFGLCSSIQEKDFTIGNNYINRSNCSTGSGTGGCL